MLFFNGGGEWRYAGKKASHSEFRFRSYGFTDFFRIILFRFLSVVFWVFSGGGESPCMAIPFGCILLGICDICLHFDF